MHGLDVTALRFSEADGNRRTGKTGQRAKPVQPLSTNLLWHSQLHLTWLRGRDFLQRNKRER